MLPEEIRKLRLYNQQLLQSHYTTPQQIVSYMAAMQAQEYAMAKWAIALRLQNPTTDTIIEKAFNNGEILRTHILRPTWHFVSPIDIKWMLTISAPRVTQANAFMYRKYNTDAKFFAKCNSLIEKSLECNNYLTRDALRNILKQNSVDTGDSIKMSIIMMQAELEGLICSGPREGNQFTYALLDERTPQAKVLLREEALAELCRRYFVSRGPATVKDFTAWSGLTVKEAKEGIAMINKERSHFTADGGEYYFKEIAGIPQKGQATFLMPDYDEYGMGYKDRSVLQNPENPQKTIFDRMLIVEGMVAGSWKRTLKKDKVIIEIQTFGNEEKKPEVKKAIEKYAAFLEKEPEYNFLKHGT